MIRFGVAFSLDAIVLLLLLHGGFPAPCCSQRGAAGAPVAPAQEIQKASPGSYQVWLSFHNEDLQEALPEFGRLLEFAPVHVDRGVTGTVNLESPNPVTREEAFRIFLGILRDNRAALIRTASATTGYTVVPGALLAPGTEQVTELPPALPSLITSTVPGIEAPKHKPIRVSEKLQASKLIRRIEPLYPEITSRGRLVVRGPVRMRVLVNEQGEVADVKIYGGGHPLLQRPAAEAVRQWRYSPFCMNGASVPVVTTVQLAVDRKGPSGVAISGATSGRPKAPMSEPVRIGTSLQASRLVHRVEPQYSEQAKRVRIVGSVLLEVTIDEQGAVLDARYLRGHTLARQAVVDAVRQWRYTPTCVDGTAVRVITTVTVPFDLREPELR